jgi:hypothetical protein
VVTFSHQEGTKDVTVRQKLLVGAVGALTPLALNFAVVDRLALESLTVLAAMGYAIRVSTLTGLGILVVLRNIDEDNHARLFQLGLAAPALATALLNGVNQRSLLQSQPSPAAPAAWTFSLAVAYAASDPPARRFEIPSETSGEQVWRGLTGRRSDRVWFVIARRESSRAAADAACDRINRTIYGFRAEVFEPYQGRGTWSVVIGEALTRADALRLRERAIGAGMLDADLWTPPPDPPKP